jgi:hypothetical protein
LARRWAGPESFPSCGGADALPGALESSPVEDRPVAGATKLGCQNATAGERVLEPLLARAQLGLAATRKLNACGIVDHQART